MYYNIEVGSQKPSSVKRLDESLNKKIDARVSTMMKHYILSLNPTAKHEWDRCILRDPLTAKRPDIAKMVADAVGSSGGSYLVSVNIEIKVLEEAAAPHVEQLTCGKQLREESSSI
jgi:hypothetical protein